MKKNIKVLVLGSSGMLGKTVFNEIISAFPQTKGTTRSDPQKNQIKFIYKSRKDLEKLFLNESFEYIINCIGILKKSNSNYSINYQIPLNLALLSKKYNFKVINISTDDVYGSLTGIITEKSEPRPNNSYAKSKLKGEINSDSIINIRTSIIGKDLEGKGILEWVIKNDGKTVDGYINQHWSGCTTLQFAQLCKYLLQKNNFDRIRSKTPIILFFPLGPITKYELIRKISGKYNIKLKVKKTNSKSKIERRFDSLFFDKKFLDRYTTEIDKALSDIND